MNIWYHSNFDQSYQNVYTWFHNHGQKSWKFVKILKIFGWIFWTWQNWGYIRTSFIIKHRFLIKRWYFCQNLKHFRKFCGSKIHRAMPYLDCLFTTEGCGFKKLIKPNDFAPSRCSRSIFGQINQFSIKFDQFSTNFESILVENAILSNFVERSYRRTANLSVRVW